MAVEVFWRVVWRYCWDDSQQHQLCFWTEKEAEAFVLGVKTSWESLGYSIDNVEEDLDE